MRINVTKTFLPPIEEYQGYIRQIWANGQLTNQGPLLKQFEKEMKGYLGLNNFHFVVNGTMALQVALRALDITEGEVITTPFSYVATTSSLLWERVKPVYVDIDAETFCIDPNKIEAAITQNTKAILPVHVFGRPCDVESIEVIAKRYNLSVIYDAAHAVGVEYKGESLLKHGEISVTSFHATKLFHTIEGGGIIARSPDISAKVELIKRFGHNYDEHRRLGINGKASEFQAAMGLCNLKHIEDIINERKKVTELYDELLIDTVKAPKIMTEIKYNYSYYPVLFKNEATLLKVVNRLEEESIYPRRYFYPSLNKLPYLKQTQDCPISEDISKRIICLPLYVGLEEIVIRKICEVVNGSAA